MKLRSDNDKLSPCDDIDKFWHLHLLNPILYYNFCIAQFNKIIDHNPTDSFDQNARRQRLTNTMNEYLQKFGDFACPNVWGVKSNLVDIKKDNCAINTYFDGQIKVTIFYTFDTKKGESVYKIWKTNNNKYDGVTFDIDIKNVGNSTLSDLANNISILTKHQKMGIYFYSVADKINVLSGKNTKDGYKYNLPGETALKNIKQDMICVLEEISHHGYC